MALQIKGAFSTSVRFPEAFWNAYYHVMTEEVRRSGGVPEWRPGKLIEESMRYHLAALGHSDAADIGRRYGNQATNTQPGGIERPNAQAYRNNLTSEVANHRPTGKQAPDQSRSLNHAHDAAQSVGDPQTAEAQVEKLLVKVLGRMISGALSETEDGPSSSRTSVSPGFVDSAHTGAKPTNTDRANAAAVPGLDYKARQAAAKRAARSGGNTRERIKRFGKANPDTEGN